MGQIAYRANLSAKSFPFITDFQGQTIVVPGPDNTFNRSLTSTEDQDKDVGIPTIFYCHNVLPAPYGFNSVGYEQLIPALANVTTFSSAKILRSNSISATVSGPKFYFAPQQSGTHYVFLVGGAAWVPVSGSVPYTATTIITYATVQGISYIYFSNIGCYKYDSATNTLILVTLSGLVAANIVGLTAYQGYTVAYDTNNIYWSSVLDILYSTNSVDFVPSLTTGAGNIRPEGARGAITVVEPATFGIAVYTASNVVSAVYSGNSRYPFNFKEVVASGGCTNGDFITYDANTGNQYAYTTSGFQTITATATQTVFPELTDFLAGQDFEDFDETTLTFNQSVLTAPMKKKLSSIADRYMVISYGISSLTHAIVYDMTQKRYGKLKLDHKDCFEFEYLDPALADAPRRSIAFLKPNGQVVVLNPSVTFGQSKGVILLGKYQYVRERLLQLEEVTMQTVHPNQSATLYALTSITGGTLDSTKRTQGYESSVSGQFMRTYNFDVVGVNFSLLIVGGFFLSSLSMKFHIHGKT